jgi:hypothetical protein
MVSCLLNTSAQVGGAMFLAVVTAVLTTNTSGQSAPGDARRLTGALGGRDRNRPYRSSDLADGSAHPPLPAIARGCQVRDGGRQSGPLIPTDRPLID